MPDSMTDEDIHALMLSMLTQRPDPPQPFASEQPEYEAARGAHEVEMMDAWADEDAMDRSRAMQQEDDAQNAELFERTLDSVLGRPPRR
jgi:hypothetical protein